MQCDDLLLFSFASRFAHNPISIGNESIVVVLVFEFDCFIPLLSSISIEIVKSIIPRLVFHCSTRTHVYKRFYLFFSIPAINISRRFIIGGRLDVNYQAISTTSMFTKPRNCVAPECASVATLQVWPFRVPRPCHNNNNLR